MLWLTKALKGKLIQMGLREKSVDPKLAVPWRWGPAAQPYAWLKVAKGTGLHVGWRFFSLRKWIPHCKLLRKITMKREPK